MSSRVASYVLAGVLVSIVAALAGFASTALADVTIAEWQFDGSSSSDFYSDSTGHGYTLTPVGTVTQDTSS
jgi:hypothetical protein